ncbi:Probable RNA-directed DNA polymerase from transposon X-element [Eumeta japonica]|uniref:Probable RNA-directed DNA polymerase from transposon X-element n=1 Tax=Eumeta variegata TaxID=151549 RepID=A0A4C1VZK5_EUMVA|nr:Probable RNA-directed DNA polymerase from transposon X-element [Eumeta japonica]
MVAMNKVFNGIMITGYFPKAWKKGKNITIPKPGKDPRNPCNLCPVTQLSHVTKIFEHALLRRLNPFLSPREEQYGFHTEHDHVAARTGATLPSVRDELRTIHSSHVPGHGEGFRQ